MSKILKIDRTRFRCHSVPHFYIRSPQDMNEAPISFSDFAAAVFLLGSPILLIWGKQIFYYVFVNLVYTSSLALTLILANMLISPPESFSHWLQALKLAISLVFGTWLLSSLILRVRVLRRTLMGCFAGILFSSTLSRFLTLASGLEFNLVAHIAIYVLFFFVGGFVGLLDFTEKECGIYSSSIAGSYSLLHGALHFASKIHRQHLLVYEIDPAWMAIMHENKVILFSILWILISLLGVQLQIPPDSSDLLASDKRKERHSRKQWDLLESKSEFDLTSLFSSQSD